MGKAQRYSEVTPINHLTINDKNSNKLEFNHKSKWLKTTKKNNKSLIVNIVNMPNEAKLRRNRRGFTPELARSKANYLAQKLGDEKSFFFYLKCAWNLSDFFIDNLLELALTKDVPAKYFSKLAFRELTRNK